MNDELGMQIAYEEAVKSKFFVFFPFQFKLDKLLIATVIGYEEGGIPIGM